MDDTQSAGEDITIEPKTGETAIGQSQAIADQRIQETVTVVSSSTQIQGLQSSPFDSGFGYLMDSAVGKVNISAGIGVVLKWVSDRNLMQLQMTELKVTNAVQAEKLSTDKRDRNADDKLRPIVYGINTLSQTLFWGGVKLASDQNPIGYGAMLIGVLLFCMGFYIGSGTYKK